MFALPRPCVPCLEGVGVCNPYCPTDPFDTSFPSGHVAGAFSALVPYYLVYKKRTGALLGIGLFIALSRIALGVHTILDVFGGALLGIGIALFAWEVYRAYFHEKLA